MINRTSLRIKILGVIYSITPDKSAHINACEYSAYVLILHINVFDIIPGCTNEDIGLNSLLKLVDFFLVTKFVSLAIYNLC